MKSIKNRLRPFIKKCKTEIILVIIILIFPAVIGLLYHLPVGRIIEIESGDLLSFYGTAFGIFGSFITYRYSKKKQEKQREAENRPVFIVDVEKKSDIFNITITKQTDSLFTYFYLYDEFVSEKFFENFSATVIYNETDEKQAELHCDYNITMDPDIIDEKDGYPKYIQILCDDTDRYTWNCEFHKVNDCGRIYYYPRVIEIL